MRPIKSIFFSLVPWIITAIYGVTMIRHYSTYLDANLVYVPRFVGSREDVLGFGFFPTWLFFLVPWLISQSIAVALRATGNKALIAAVAAFLVVSGSDYWFYSILESQVPNQLGG